jgi:RHS repeat-associated protein
MVGDSWLGNVGTYGWDTENRLLQIVHANGMIETNTYNAHGLRESYTGTGASGRDRFIYDGVNVLLEKLPGGTFAIYTQQPESPGGLYSGRANGASSYQVPDHAGHVRQLTDANGAVTDGSVIDAWGYERYHLGTSYDPYRGFGEYGYRQEDSKRLYTQARHMRVDQGRWMSVDPVETEPPYLYVGDRPTWAVDPSGERAGGDGALDWLGEVGRAGSTLPWELPLPRVAEQAEKAILAAVGAALVSGSDAVVGWLLRAEPVVRKAAEGFPAHQRRMYASGFMPLQLAWYKANTEGHRVDIWAPWRRGRFGALLPPAGITEADSPQLVPYWAGFGMGVMETLWGIAPGIVGLIGKLCLVKAGAASIWSVLEGELRPLADFALMLWHADKLPYFDRGKLAGILVATALASEILREAKVPIRLPGRLPAGKVPLEPIPVRRSPGAAPAVLGERAAVGEAAAAEAKAAEAFRKAGVTQETLEARARSSIQRSAAGGTTAGKAIAAAGVEWEDYVRSRTGGKSETFPWDDAKGKRMYEIDSTTATSHYHAKDVNVTAAKNFLNQSTRRGIKAYIAYARTQGMEPVWWFRREPLPEIRAWIERQGGTVISGEDAR